MKLARTFVALVFVALGLVPPQSSAVGIVTQSGGRAFAAAASSGTGNVDLSGLGASTAANTTAYTALSVPAMAAGTAFTDPTTGTRTVKVTSSTVPNSNQHFNEYSTLGLQISQPWGAGSDQYTIWYMDGSGGAFLVDYQLGGTTSNYRAGPGGESRVAFSRLAGEERTMRVVTSSTQLRRYNTATNAFQDTGNFPYTWSTNGNNDTWLQLNHAETYATAKCSASTCVTALKLADGTVTTRTGLSGVDELYSGYGDVALINMVSMSSSRLWNIPADTLTALTAPSANFTNTTHVPSLRGASGATSAFPVFDSASGGGALHWSMIDESGANSGNQVPSPGWYWGQIHSSGHWQQQPAGYANQYFLLSGFRNSDGGNTASMAYQIAFVKCSDFSKKVVGGHYSVGDTGAGNTPGGTDKYRSQPHATISDDGKLIMFSSNMLDSGRLEVFIMETPRTN